MNEAAALLIWAIVIHLVIDWPCQNEWMALNKARRRERGESRKNFTERVIYSIGYMPEDPETFGFTPAPHVPGPWWDRHPAAYVHAGLHGLAQLLIFPWWAALAIGLTHLVIDTRAPVEWWSKLIRQTQPGGLMVGVAKNEWDKTYPVPHYDIGTEVRFWTDQVFHIAIVALAALAVTHG